MRKVGAIGVGSGVVVVAALVIWLTGHRHASAEPPLAALAVRFGPGRAFDEAEALTVSGDTLWVAHWRDPGGGDSVLIVPLNASTLAPSGAPITVRSAIPAVALAAAPGGSVYVRAGGRTCRIAGGRIVWPAPSAVPQAAFDRLRGTPGFGLTWAQRGGELVAIDPATGARRVLPLPRAIRGSSVAPTTLAPAVAAGLMWVAESTASNHVYLEAVGSHGGAARAPVAVGRGIPVLLLAAAGRLWLADNSQGPFSTLWQVDPRSGRVIGHTRLPPGFLPMFGVAVGRALWLGEQQPDGSVRRVELDQRSA